MTNDESDAHINCEMLRCLLKCDKSTSTPTTVRARLNQLVFEWFKILTPQTPAATRVQPAYRMAEMLLNRLSPDFLIPPKIRQDSALQAARNLATQPFVPYLGERFWSNPQF
jgi:hypothetical protein